MFKRSDFGMTAFFSLGLISRTYGYGYERGAKSKLSTRGAGLDRQYFRVHGTGAWRVCLPCVSQALTGNQRMLPMLPRPPSLTTRQRGMQADCRQVCRFAVRGGQGWGKPQRVDVAP